MINPTREFILSKQHSYPYFGRMEPDLGGFREPGRYNPKFLPPDHPATRPGP